MENNCTCASFFTVRGVHKEDCAAYVPEATSSEWEEEFATTFRNHGFIPSERLRFLDFIQETITKERTQAKKEVVDELRNTIGMLEGWYFYKPEEGFTGEVQYIPKHIALNAIDPSRAMDSEGNRVLLPEQESK